MQRDKTAKHERELAKARCYNKGTKRKEIHFMNERVELFRTRMNTFAKKLNDNRYIKIIMSGFMGAAALTIGASFLH